MSDLLSVSSSVFPPTAHVVSVKGQEGLSELYQFEVGVQAPMGEVDYDGAVNAAMTLTLDTGDASIPYEFNGVIAAIDHLHSHDGQELFRVVMVPRLWHLTLTRHSRVFTDNSIIEILEAIFVENDFTFKEGQDTGADVELHITPANYPKREFIAMYKESYFDFIARWLEREGMFFYFRHKGGKEQLVISDEKAQTDGLSTDPVRYEPLSEGDTSALQALDSFRSRSRMLPKRVEMADYNYQSPQLKRLSDGSDVGTGDFGNIVMYGHNCLDAGQAKRYADIRKQALLASENVSTGWGRVYNLRTGYPFQLDNHPRFNGHYLVTRLEHFACQSAASPQVRKLLELDFDFDGEYRVSLSAIANDCDYKSPERTLWPRIEGFEHAVICGEANSEYAQLDAQGRYTVNFYFDESDLVDGKKSCQVRLQQPYGGGHEGFHFNLVKGTEVAVYFAGGDPDRPLICGVAPNPQKPSPTNVEHHTINKITTINDNRIWIEDNSGQQFVYVYCPIETTFLHFGVELGGFNLILNTEGHAHFHIGGDQVIDVDVTLTETVIDDVTFNYNNNWDVNLTNNWVLEIGGNVSEHVVLNVDLIYEQNYSLTILGVCLVDVTGDTVYNFQSIWSCTVASETTFLFKADWNVTCLANTTEIVLGDDVDVVIGNETNVTVANQTNLIVGTRTTTIVGADTTTCLAPKSWWTIGAKTEGTISASAGITIGAKAELAASAEISAKIGVAIEAAASIKIAFTTGLKAEFDSTVNMRAAAVTELVNTPIWVRNGTLTVFNSAIYLIM